MNVPVFPSGQYYHHGWERGATGLRGKRRRGPNLRPLSGVGILGCEVVVTPTPWPVNWRMAGCPTDNQEEQEARHAPGACQWSVMARHLMHGRK